MRALSSQQPRFLNNLCASVCLSVTAEASNMCRKLASASYTNFDTHFSGVPKRVPKITSTYRIQAHFPGPLKKSFFWCYLSSQLTELIDMLHSEEMKISMGTRAVPERTLQNYLRSLVGAGFQTAELAPGSCWGAAGATVRCVHAPQQPPLLRSHHGRRETFQEALVSISRAPSIDLPVKLHSFRH